MSTRTSRSSQREPSSAKKERPPSPLSPTKMSRTEEKKTLGNLNDRLATYIDRVRSLEQDKGRLQKQISTIEEIKTQEIKTMRNNYSHELASARSALDDVSKQKAKLDIEVESLRMKDKENTKKLKAKEDEVSRLLYNNKKLEQENHDLRAQLNAANSELSSVRPEMENLKNKLNDARQKLEDETIQRIDAQNKLLTAKEEADFNAKFLEEQLNETRQRKQIEIEEVDSRAQSTYEKKLADSLQELRDNYERQLAENRSAFEQNYEKRINDLSTRLADERGAAASSIQEKREFETKMEAMTSKMNQMQSNVDAMQRRIDELMQQNDEMGRNFRAEDAKKQREIDFMRSQLDDMTNEFKELTEIKIALDLEIQAYRKLLEGEEARMGLSPSPEEREEGRGRKRKRIDLEESYIGVKMNTTFSQPGALLIQPLDSDKNCIKVENTGDNDVNLGGMQLRCLSDGVESSYKFTRSHKVAAGGTITVYSSDVSGVEHSPSEGVLLMKTGAWSMGDEVSIQLVNKEGEEMAGRETNWQKEVMGGSQSFIGDVETSPVKAVEGGEKCSIM